MKIHRCLLFVIITLMISVLHCSCQSLEERALSNDLNYPELDRSKMAIASLNDLLNVLDFASRQEMGGNQLGSFSDYDLIDSMMATRFGQPRENSDSKRSWRKMNAVWGKRGNRNSGWTKFAATWGKREPRWNNLKGLWGKRANKWGKLTSVWGKRQEISQSY
uniref:Uncharacterized protein n=1 Tax=Anopheles epiroticus TaxID=199890 RepID=A0A182PWU7_9DIPT